MEFSNLESENDHKEEKITTFVENVTPLVVQGSITKDNPSPSNGLTGLEQVILFEAGPYMDDIFDLEFVKALITVHKALLAREAEELLSGEDEEEWNDEWEENSSLGDPYWDQPYIDDDYYEEYIEPDYEDIYYKIDDREFKKKIRRIAVGYEMGTYTDDNQSRISGLTGIGQVISYAAELLCPDTIPEKRGYCEQIKKIMRGYMLGFRGGSKMSLFGEDLRITVND